jgi:TonB family protein
MLKFAAILALAAAAIGPGLTVANAEPAHVSGAVASKLEKHRAGINNMDLPPPRAAQGTVRLDFTVQPDGTVADIKDIDSNPNVVHKYLAIAATNSLRQWTYNPYMVDGKPTAMRVTIEFNFTPPGHADITYP